MNDSHNTTDTDAPSWKELLAIIFLKLIVLPAIIIGIVAAVTLNLGQSLSNIRPFPDGAITAVYTNPPDWMIVIAVACGALLLYGHFFTDHPVLAIALGKHRFPEDSRK